jgi:ABC-2 type transport system permease protein
MLLINRGILRMLKSPFALAGGLGMSLFFLVVYNAGIGGVAFLPQFGGGGYLAFLLPMSLVSLAMGSAAGAGQSLHDDMASGYFRRLYLSPVRRWTFVVAPVTADAVATALGSLGVIAAGIVFGVPLQFGAASVAGLLLLSLLWGVTLSALSAGVMVRTGSAEGARIVTTAVFPLIFLSTTFMPRELIAARWLRVVSWGNPVTYLLEGMRYLLAGTASVQYFLLGLGLTGSAALAALLFALSGTRKILV